MQLSPMQVSEAETVLGLWNRACIEAVAYPLPDASAKKILDNLRQYAEHQRFHCWVAKVDSEIVAFVTFGVSGHAISSGLVGEIEELYATRDNQNAKIDLVQQAVIIMKQQGAGVITTKVAVDEAKELSFWKNLKWEQDTVNFNIYSDVPADPNIQTVWDSYQPE